MINIPRILALTTSCVYTENKYPKSKLNICQAFIDNVTTKMLFSELLKDETITYTTYGDHTYLDNLPILISRWNGPISLGQSGSTISFEK